MNRSTYLPSALLIGDDPVNALGVARNLGREGIGVYRLGASDSDVFRSRYIESSRVTRDLDACPDSDYLAWIRRASADDGPVVIFPLTDLHVLRLTHIRRSLDDRFLLPGFTSDSAEILVNKRQFYKSLAEFGVPHPATAYPSDNSGFESEAERIGYPVFLKPEISPLFSRRFNTKGFLVHDRFELARQVQLVRASGLPVVMQEIIPGGAECLHGCAGYRTADQTLFFCYRRVREFPSGFGTSSLQESIAPFVAKTNLLEYLRHIGYTGIFEAEFKLDPRDGILKMIEINARPWWQTTHPTISGINIVKAAFDHASGRTIENRPYVAGTKWIHLYNDYFAGRAAGLGLVQWLRSFQGTRAYDIWSADDMKPMMYFVKDLIRRKLSKKFRNPPASMSANTATGGSTR